MKFFNCQQINDLWPEKIFLFLLFTNLLFSLLNNTSEINTDIYEKRLGTFYRFTKDEQFVPLKRSVGISNGLAWNEKTNKFYYIDSVDSDVKEFDYDPVTGNLCM